MHSLYFAKGELNWTSKGELKMEMKSEDRATERGREGGSKREELWEAAALGEDAKTAGGLEKGRREVAHESRIRERDNQWRCQFNLRFF